MRASLTVRVDSGAMRELEGFVERFAAEQRLAVDDKARTLIVLEELLTNLSKYGYPEPSAPQGMAEVALELFEDLLTIEFIDNGQAFDPFAKTAPDFDQAAENRPIGGLGLHMVRTLSDEARYSWRDGRNFVQLSWRRSQHRTR